MNKVLDVLLQGFSPPKLEEIGRFFLIFGL